MTDTLEILPHSQSFTELNKDNSVYVDKTGIILKLLSRSYPGPYFLARPRRFGKTVLIDTIETIFSGNRDYFEGLEIFRPENKFQWSPYPVIRIDMDGLGSNPDIFDDALVDMIDLCAESHNIGISRTDPATAITSLIRRLSFRHAESCCASPEIMHKPKNNVVLLVDEYDSPLLDNIQYPLKFESILLKLQKFYTAIKASSNYLKFSFITGMTNFKKTSQFFCSNNIIDLTLESDYSEICGFTETEISKFYNDNLLKSIPKLISAGNLFPDATFERLIKYITNCYGGYSWGSKTMVINPFSVKCLLENNELNFYWHNSRPSFIDYILPSKQEFFSSMFNNTLTVKGPIEVMDTNYSEDISLLFHAGYLTIDHIVGDGRNRITHFKIPNSEASNAITREFALKVLAPAMMSNEMKNAIKKNWK
jgi:hypothetical protein